MDLKDTVREFLLREFAAPEQAGEADLRRQTTLLAAFSGGRDSSVLLRVLAELQPEFGYRLKAVHVEHGIRPDAMDDACFCAEQCRSLGVEFLLYHVRAKEKAENEAMSLEEAARQLRYECFEKAVSSEKAPVSDPEKQADGTAEEANVKVVLAHHRTDQAETVLLHLLRGSGVKGLCGMQPVRGIYWRPMLTSSEADIEAYAREHQLTWREDSTNADVSYTRNRIRHQLIPLLEKEYNPEIVAALCRTALLASEEEMLLSETDALWEEKDRQPVFDLRGFQEGSVSRRKRRLRRWLEANGCLKNAEEVHIEALLDLAQGQSGRRVSLPGGLTVEKSYDILYFNFFSEEEPDMPVFSTESVPAETVREQFPNGVIPDFPYEKWMDAGKIHGGPCWRHRRAGDYLVIRRRKDGQVTEGKQKLQDFFINQKVPREERQRMLLLADNDHILWVPGFRMGDDLRITENTKTVLHIFIRREQPAEHEGPGQSV